MIAVGCDSGAMSVFELNPTDPLKYSEIYSDKVHNSRIMRIFIDEKQGQIYTIGEDKFMRSVDIKAKCLTHEVFVSKSKLTEMVVDQRNKIAYIGDRNGSIMVASLSTNPPTIKQVVKTSSEGSIRGLEADFANKRIFCSCHEDAYIHIFKLNDPSDPEGRIDKTVSIKTAPKPRVIRWWDDRQELYIGHQDGLISVINFTLNPNGPIYSNKSHEGNVNALQIIAQEGVVITGSGDKTIKFWCPPDKWNKEKGEVSPKKVATKKKVIVDDDEDEYEDRAVAKKKPAQTKEASKQPTSNANGKATKKKRNDSSDESSEGGYYEKPSMASPAKIETPVSKKFTEDSKPATKKEAPKPAVKEPPKKVFVDDDSDELGGWND